jgi:phosphate transport system protein
MMLPEQQRRRRHFQDEMDALQDRLLEMAGIVEELVRVAVDALERRDPKPAEWAKAEDDRVDELEIQIDERAMELLLISQNLERIADLSTNIAEDVVFMVEGQTIKHHSDIHSPDDDEEPEGAPRSEAEDAG